MLPEINRLRYTGLMRFVVIMLFSVFSSCVSAAPSYFDDAQRAAAEGRYDEVIQILTAVIDERDLPDDELATAFSNRGIAFSLLEQHPLAVRDLQEAIRLDPEHLLSLNHLGIMAEHIDLDYASAVAWYGRAAELGYAASMVNLGHLLRAGKGTSADVVRAFELFQHAAEQGYDIALVPLGEMYLIGIGAERNYSAGLNYLRLAADKGLVTAHYHLGRASEKGWGVEQDYKVAAFHYHKAAVQGHPASQGALGYLYRRGWGHDKNFVEAARWYRLAAEQGDVQAANRLAWIMATCPVKAVCNGKVALEFARLAVDANPIATNMDSLAAAYARLGEFDEAMVVIEQLLKTQKLSDSARAKYARRIERYRNGIPFQI